MTGAEFAEAGEKLFGPGWKHRMANWLGVNYATVNRHVNAAEVPGPVARAVQLRLERVNED